jgi:peptidoglycan/LPS O-acetylase OafA/YrhL
MSAGPQLVRESPGRFHRPELDALRFGAFLLVFLHHALPHASSEIAGLPRVVAQGIAAVGRAGALGVDLFFALSAYLITELLRREQLATGALDIRAFYVRRILRIWPLYFLALFVLAPILGEPLPILPYALLAGNWACAIGGFPASSFALLWSVSIEEQFYLAWPRIMSVRSAIVMLVVASITRIGLAATGVVHPGIWCNTLARLDPIAGGALLSYALAGGTPALSNLKRLVLLCAGAFGFVAAGGFAPHDGWATVISYPVAAASALAILCAALGLPMRSRVLAYLGKISFGLYVFHAAAWKFVPFAPAAFLLTIAVASLSYRFLESPFLKLKEKFAKV